MKKNTLLFIYTCAILLLQAPLAWTKTRNVVTDYKADNTGATYATLNIQKAIDECQPGDVLLFPDGKYLLDNGLNLKSDMTVYISKGALIQANTDHVWLKNRSHVINGENLKNVTMLGGGKIDGGGLVYPRGDYDRPRPGRGIRFFKCSNIVVRNLSVYNIPNFAVDFYSSKDIVVDSLIIRGRGFFNLHGSADGLDIEGCSNVSIANCDIEVGDDALCIKASTEDPQYPCNNIRIKKCVLASTCNAFKIGTGTLADIYDIIAEDIIINKHSNPGVGNPVPTGDCISAIAIESNDRHRVYNVICRNFTINNCYNPIYFDLQNRKNNNPPGVMGKLDNILLENINCIKSVSQPIIFNWQCDGANKMKDITFKNVIIHNFGTEAGANLTCMDGNYPDANKNGIANSYGIWARGLDGLKLIDCKFYDDGGSKREKFVFDSSVQNVDINAKSK
jgi:polygalacturonase